MTKALTVEQHTRPDGTKWEVRTYANGLRTAVRTDR